jgi:hypothetical protein
MTLTEVVKKFKSSLTMAGGSVGLVVSVFGINTYLNDNYVTKAEFQAERTLRIKEKEYLEDKFVELVTVIEESNNILAKEIKDSKGYPLTVQRDILLAKPSRTPAEEAELQVLQTKLRELNLDD